MRLHEVPKNPISCLEKLAVLLAGCYYLGGLFECLQNARIYPVRSACSHFLSCQPRYLGCRLASCQPAVSPTLPHWTPKQSTKVNHMSQTKHKSNDVPVSMKLRSNNSFYGNRCLSYPKHARIRPDFIQNSDLEPGCPKELNSSHSKTPESEQMDEDYDSQG